MFLTDGNIETLNVMKVALARHSILEERVKVTLMQGVYLPDSSIDLFFYSKRKLTMEVYDVDFRSAAEFVQAKYDSVLTCMNMDIFSVPDHRELNRWMETNQVDELYYEVSDRFDRRHRRSFDLRDIVKNPPCEVSAINWNHTAEAEATLFDPLVKLFFNHESFEV